MGSKKDNAKSNNSRRRLLPAIILVVLMAVVLCAVSDVPFVKSARDALMQKLGYDAIEQNGQS